MHVSNTVVIAAVILVPILLVVAYVVQSNQTLSVGQFFSQDDVVRINRVSVAVEVADTQEARLRGLSGRTSLPSGTGLLFVFEETDKHGIWMRDMHFPIDIVWIGEDLTVVDISRNIPPDSFPTVFYPRRAVRYVLEVNALFAEEKGIQIGDGVEIPKRYRLE